MPIRPLSHPSKGVPGGTPSGLWERQGIVSEGPLSRVAVGPCAIGTREPSQGREAAALSGNSDVPQVT